MPPRSRCATPPRRVPICCCWAMPTPTAARIRSPRRARVPRRPRRHRRSAEGGFGVPAARPASARAGGRAAQAAFGGALGRGGGRIAVALALGAFAAAWAWAAHVLWRSSVPAGLHPPHLHAGRYFGVSFLSRSSSFERFRDIDGLLAT